MKVRAVAYVKYLFYCQLKFLGFSGYMFEISGIIKEVHTSQTFGKGFKKREFLLSVRHGKKIEDIKFECHGDKTELLGHFAQGDLVDLEFHITGREWNGRHFNNLVCFGIESKLTEGQKEVLNLSEEKQKEVDEEVPF